MSQKGRAVIMNISIEPGNMFHHCKISPSEVTPKQANYDTINIVLFIFIFGG
ncbi:hypothetical protein KSD_74120 [Ktedonobacter sp. SOSP1-85]|nr:hypothetical protein KSD_74120 [Ktedonobacter sp. SOSP1-85]